MTALFSDKGPYGISSVLKKKRWSTGVMAYNINETRGIEYYEIYAELTEFGLGHVDDIVKLIFQVIWYSIKLFKLKLVFIYIYFT